VLETGGLACINVGDATRTVDGDFQLYSNHSRILTAFLDRGYAALPDILWRKPNNAPTKFLGSGMLPAGAYVTYEHEYILILRKGPRRLFTKPEEKRLRKESAYFWEERNAWFSDIWRDIFGAGQALADEVARKRSAAFPFELAYRLICMFSVKGDTVLDPFSGTGTTLVAALASGRSAVGVEIDRSFVDTAYRAVLNARDFANVYTMERLLRHMEFVRVRTREKGPLKYKSRHYGFPVMTAQETDMLIRDVKEVVEEGEGVLSVTYGDEAASDIAEARDRKLISRGK
jgi:DNA modification methylase